MCTTLGLSGLNLESAEGVIGQPGNFCNIAHALWNVTNLLKELCHPVISQMISA